MPQKSLTLSRKVDDGKPLLAGNLTQAIEDALAVVSVGGTPDFTLVSAHPVHPKASTVMQSLASNSSSSVGLNGLADTSIAHNLLS